MNQFVYLLKQAWVSLKKNPGFVITVVTTMGTTLGALLCVLTLGYLLIVEPLPYPDQQRLYKVNHLLGDKSEKTNIQAFTYPGLMHLYKNQDVFEQAALVHYGRDVLTSSLKQATLNTGYVTPEWFDLLDVKMQLGRGFEVTEALDTFNPVAILSHKIWLQEFAGALDILQQKVSFSGVSYRVVGVLAKNFVEPRIKQQGMDVGIWFPWDYNLDVRLKERWDTISWDFTFVGKLKSEISVEQAQQTLTPLVNDIWIEHVRSFDTFTDWAISIELQTFQNAIVGDSANTAYLLIAGVFGLVLIAVTNIANLFMSRTVEKQRQLSIAAALGAKKSHLFKGLLAESGLLMALSILVALVISSFGFHALQLHLHTVLPRVNELSLNFISFGGALFFAAVITLAFAFLSSKMINYRALNSTLQSSGKGAGVQVSKRLRQGLIVSQIVVTTLLVFANTSLFKEAVNSIIEPTGFYLENMTEMRLSISASQSPHRDEVAADMLELKAKLLALPQIESISHTTSVMDGFGLWGLSAVASGQQFTPQSTGGSTNYFTMMGQPLLEGDNFSEADVKDGNKVMIINDVFAKRLNPNGSALGMQLASDSAEQPFTIVGVVKGIRMPASDEIPMRVYVPSPLSTTVMTLKLHAGQAISRQQIVSVIKQVSHSYSLFSLNKLKEIEISMLFTQYTTAVATSSLAIITLFLAGVGLYGVFSYDMQMRRFELGTRMAMGAKRKDLVRLIVKDNVWLIMLGVASSIVVMLGIYIGYKDVLSAYMSVDLLPMFMSTILSIALLSLFACYWPLRKYINQPAIYSLRGSD